MKVLIVEDEEALLDIFEQQLRQENHKLASARDGQEAIELAKSFLPDVIILDLVLPKKDGFEVLQELKADPKTKDIPVIVASNLSDPETMKKASELGAVDFYIKADHSIFEILDRVAIAKKM